MNALQDSVEIINLSRRSFRGAISAAGLVLAAGFPGLALADDEAKYRVDSLPQDRAGERLLVAIGTDGIVTITGHRPEVGQSVHMILPMVVAEELAADWSRVRVAQAQGDDGLRGVGHLFEPMRRCGAAARTMLEQAAAVRWQVPFGEVDASNHQVVHRPTSRRLGYGDLADAASRLKVPAGDTLRLKTAAQFA
jgi:isoquinoline 1-oxidoreductase beta subunit